MLENVIVTDILDTTTVISSKGRRFTMRDRKSYGLSFCKSGKITYSHGERKYISTPDRAILLPQGASYTLYNNEGGEFPVINFSCAEVCIKDFLEIPITSLEGYLRLYRELSDCMLTGTQRLKAFSLLYDIFHRLSYESIDEMRILKPAIKLITEDIRISDLSNKKLADACGISEVYFRKLFKENYSVSPRQYILNMKIKKSSGLLRETAMTVGKIAEIVGFSNVYHFSYTFKKQMGMTPTEYRKHQAQGI